MLNVKLIACTPDPERTIAAAAKICYSSSDAETIMEGLTPEKTEGFLNMLTEIGHASPIEHASFTFAIEGVSRSLLAQITRHRIASYSVQSQRYVKLKEGIFTYITPPEIAKDPVAHEKYQKAMEDCHKNYLELADALQARHTADLVAQGVSEKEAKRRADDKFADEQRRALRQRQSRFADLDLRTGADEEQSDKGIDAGLEHRGGKAADLQNLRTGGVENRAQQQRDDHDAAGNLFQGFQNRNVHK